MGLVIHRFKAQMERVPQQPSSDVPQSSLVALNDYLTKRGGAHAGSAAKYFGRILEQKGDHEPAFPDVFKVSNAANAQQWCLVRCKRSGGCPLPRHSLVAPGRELACLPKLRGVYPSLRRSVGWSERRDLNSRPPVPQNVCLNSHRMEYQPVNSLAADGFGRNFGTRLIAPAPPQPLRPAHERIRSVVFRSR